MARLSQPRFISAFFLTFGPVLVPTLMGQDKASVTSIEKNYINNVRQITFEGRRAGEGYFSSDGSVMVFQSERREDNPFFQIYLLDFATGDIEPISPGSGKTTCAWVHPDNQQVLFSSTHDDPEARVKQKQEFELRESGKQKRYSWDYDPTYEIYSFDRLKKSYTQLTHDQGYDAEASYSPDGKLIAFASNRKAYTTALSADDQTKFEIDLAHAMEIFIMNADGSNVRQLTDVPGYDGGPFFSPDGSRICWRRFSEDGVTAEIMTMNIDGSDQRQLTKLGAMSWAPFYHPSGKYLIFTTNLHGFGNFELYAVAADGKSEPIRLTDTDGFDALASFSPDGKKLTWTSNRNAKKESQIYLADWNHDAVIAALSNSTAVPAAVVPAAVPAKPAAIDEPEAANTGIEAAKQAAADFDPQDIMRHVDFLCRKELAGRMTGSAGERKATAYVAAYMDYLGLQPAGDNGTWFQSFEFPDGSELGPKNQLTVSLRSETSSELVLETDWRPLSFSGNVAVEKSPVVFAGYGIVAPEQGSHQAYDSYSELDVKGKWVLVFRYVPENVSAEIRQHLQFYAGLRKKAFYARDRGAIGLIVVSGPSSQVRQQLVPMENDFSPSGSSLAAVSISDDVAGMWLKNIDKDLSQIQTELDNGTATPGFEITELNVGSELDIKKITGHGRNVVGRLAAGAEPSSTAVIVGAHIDHLGLGKMGSSLAKEAERGTVHFGADDNASGVAGMLEIAEYLASQQRAGKLQLKRDVIFAGWSGEELGLHGSKHYTDSLGGTDVGTTTANMDQKAQPKSFHDFVLSIDAQGTVLLNGEATDLKDLAGSLEFIGKSVPDFVVEIQSSDSTPADKLQQLTDLVKKHGVQQIKSSKLVESKPRYLAAALNMDMIGRMEDKLILQGISSSDYWPSIIESKNAVVGLPVTLSGDTDLPTDASSFYQAGVPILSAFTGSHTDYHTPRDTPEKLNYAEAARIARLMGLITRSLAADEKIPTYLRQAKAPKETPRGGLRAYLGSVPSYGDDVVGVKLSDVTAGAPAAKAGVLAGDIIVGIAGRKIENIYDYTAVIDALKVGQETEIVVERGGEKLTFKITPGSRE